MLFFAIVYTVEGIGQAKAGVIWQPLTHYLKETQNWDPVQIAASLAVLDVPWVIKPLYGVISDFLPLFGYRRRSYLLLANVGAVAAFLWTTQVLTPAAIVFALLLTAIAMAVSSTVCGALLVENGQKHQASATFINQQWLWFNIAVMVGSLAGGGLIEVLSAPGALHAAATIAAVAPIAVIVSSIALVDERHAGINLAELRRALRGFIDTLRSRTLWLIAAFLFCYYFSPGFGTPLYFHMSDNLHFSQGAIGMLSSVSAGGWIVGGLLYRWLLTGMTTRALLNLSILSGTLVTLAFLGMVDETSAIAIYFVNGIAGMIANIATLTLAAEHCPERSEGFAFAALMSVINLANPLADTIGAFLYQHLFHQALAPLIVVSAAFTAFIFVLVPLLDRFATTPLKT
ncbi:MAG TPA: MFS transporter [Acetobacteraceae bacterium]|nr:MFS transporter [Acetobacteraceae bacterium]